MKRKKVLNILLVVLIVFSSVLLVYKYAPKVKADSGFDSSYDSGSSWDSGSSDWGSSSSSWGSSYSGSSSSSSSSGGLLSFTTIIAIMIVIAIIMAKNKGNISNVSNFSLDHRKEVSDDEVSKLIPNFNKEEFLKARYNDYLEIQRAWTDFDYDTIRSMVTDELYNQYEMQLDTLKVKNEKNVMSDFVYKDAMITNINSENNKITVTIELICSFYDYIEKNGSVTRGTKATKITQHYEMKFVANLSNKKKDKCPNCGAKLENSASQKCEYCGSIVSNVSDKWVLSKKESKRQG